jgi:hypothetical protein
MGFVYAERWLSGLRQRISVRYTGDRIGGSNPSPLRHGPPLLGFPACESTLCKGLTYNETIVSFVIMSSSDESLRLREGPIADISVRADHRSDPVHAMRDLAHLAVRKRWCAGSRPAQRSFV